MQENSEEQKDKVYTVTLPSEALFLIDEALREYGGMLHIEEYPYGFGSHDREATLKKEHCFRLRMALRKSCPNLFKEVNPEDYPDTTKRSE